MADHARNGSLTNITMRVKYAVPSNINCHGAYTATKAYGRGGAGEPSDERIKPESRSDSGPPQASREVLTQALDAPVSSLGCTETCNSRSDAGLQSSEGLPPRHWRIQSSRGGSSRGTLTVTELSTVLCSMTISSY